MKGTFLPLALMAVLAQPAAGADISRSFSYFSIGGRTLGEIEAQLRARGPQVQATGQRHPGATRMEFNTRISYADSGTRCRVAGVKVSVRARVFLPRWRNRRTAEPATALIWDTLSKDIKRHEESHLGIAKRHARRIEEEVAALGSSASCARLQERADEATARILQAHDRAQSDFDRVESVNFERRMMRLLNYRLEQIEKGRRPG